MDTLDPKVTGKMDAQHEPTQALLEVASLINIRSDTGQVLDRILLQTQCAIPCQAAMLVLIDDDRVRVASHLGLGTIPELAPLLANSHSIDVFRPIATIFRTHQPLVVQDSNADPHRQNIPGLEWVQSYASAGMLMDEKLVGLLVLMSNQAGYFRAEVGSVLQAFANQAALVIQYARLYENELRTRQIAEALQEASQALTKTLNLGEILEILLDYLHKLTPYDNAIIYLTQDETIFRLAAQRGCEGVADIACNTGLPDNLVQVTDPEQRLSFNAYDDPYLNQLVRDQNSMLLSDINSSFLSQSIRQAILSGESICSLISIPLVVAGKVTGLCILGKNEPGFYSSEHLRITEILIRQAAIIVQNARLFEKTQAAREQLLSLSRRLVEVQENERRYISSELHDEAGQALASLKVGLHLLNIQANQSETGVPTQEMRGIIHSLNQQVDQLFDNLHRLAANLRPASLDHLGLVPALQQLLELLNEQTNLQAQFVTLGLDERLPTEVETALYRIVQEALTNVIRHAHSKRVDVLLEQRNQRVIAIIEDNGSGFDPTLPFDNHHFGLFSMRERAEMLGGRFVVESIPNQGTTIYAEIPLSPRWNDRLTTADSEGNDGAHNNLDR